MSDVSIRTVGTYLNEDQRWLYGGKPDGPNLDIVLDRSGFDLVTAFPNGFIPSGVALAEVAATGLYVPYAGDSESASIAVNATGGTFTITIEGQTTAAIAFNATAAAVQAAVQLLPGIGPDDVTVTGGPGAAGGGTPYVLAWGGRYAGQDAPAVTTGAGSLTGGAGTAAVTTTAGGGESPAGEGTGRGVLFASVAYDRDSTGDIAAALCRDATIIESMLPTGHGVDAAFKAATPHLKFI
jgi:hypothetical protein